MSGQRGAVVLTGANGGLGNAIARQLASSTEHHGIFTVRTLESAAALRQALRPEITAKTELPSSEIMALDLSRMDEVREVAAAVNKLVDTGTIPLIRAIILNAGYEECNEQTWTEDGLDSSFAINYLGHWLLTLLLLQSMDREEGRVVWVSSWAQNPLDRHNIMNGSFGDDRYKTMITGNLDPIAKGTWSLDSEDKTNWMAGYRRYGVSKMCGVAMIHELQKRIDQDPVLNNISVLAIDPSAMATGIIRQSSWFVRGIVFPVFSGLLGGLLVRVWPNGTWRTPQKSARDVLAAALSTGPAPLSERPKGIYLNGSELGEYSSEAKDPRKGLVIWQGSVKFAKLEDGDTALQNWR